MTYHLSPDVTLGKTAPTSTLAFLGTRGSGKTYGAGVLAEAFLDARVQIVVVDPVGTWYALRLDRNGKKRGYDIPVFGGIHGDVPLEPTSGALVARLIVERGVSIVLDVSDFTDGQQHRFVTDLCRDVFQLKKRNKSPLHFFFEEAHEFFPQFVDAAAAPMVGATKRLWKIGRNYGIGGTIISQRAAEVNKGALNLSDEIFTGKLKAPEDIKRVDGWANANGVSDDMIKRLPDLPKGTLIAWRESGAVETIFHLKKTFDASKTPDGQESKIALAPIDLDEVRAAMAEVVERAAADDPKTLRARISELERELKKAQEPQPSGVSISPDDVRRLLVALDKLDEREKKFLTDTRAFTSSVNNSIDQLGQRQQVVTSELGSLRSLLKPSTAPVILAQATRPMNGTSYVDPGRGPRQARVVESRPRSPTAPNGNAVELSRCARSILKVLAQRGKATDAQLAALSGYKRTSSTFANGLSELRVMGYLEGPPDLRLITRNGMDVAGDAEPLPRGPELVEYWMRRLTKCGAAMLSVVHVHGSISREKLAEITGYRETSSTFANGISEIRTLDLVTGPNGGDLTIADVFQ